MTRVDPERLLLAPAYFTPPETTAENIAAAAAVVIAFKENPTKERWNHCGIILAAICDAGYGVDTIDIIQGWLRGYDPSWDKDGDCLPNDQTLRAFGPAFVRGFLENQK